MFGLLVLTPNFMKICVFMHTIMHVYTHSLYIPINVSMIWCGYRGCAVCDGDDKANALIGSMCRSMFCLGCDESHHHLQGHQSSHTAVHHAGSVVLRIPDRHTSSSAPTDGEVRRLRSTER